MKIIKLLLVIVSMNAMINQSSAQRNTPAGATYPFPQNVTYAYGIKPTNANSADVASAYDSWRSAYASDCGGGKWRIKADDPNITFSEGIGYGMLLSAYAADKTLFDGLWAYYKQFSNSNGIMNWKISGCSSVSASGGATDGDLDAAFALYLAHHQWGSAGTVNYLSAATTLINNIMAKEVNQSNWNLLNGDGWGQTGLTCYNPSYWAPAYYRVFKTITGDSKWDNVLARCYTMYNANKNSTTGFVSNWCDANGAPSGCAGPVDYGWDACRAPWRMATDVIWYGNTTSKTILNTNAAFWNGKGAANVSGPIALDGNDNGDYHVGTFIGTWAAGTVGCDATYQSHCNAMYTENKNWTPPANNYFNACLRLIGMFVQSGNFYLPPLGAPPATCQDANLGVDKSICGVGSISLSHGSGSTTNKSFKWYKDGNLISGATSSTYNATSAGTFKVVVDSASKCTQEDEVVISGTLPTPSLGADKKLCNPAFFDLFPTNQSSFPAGTTYQWQKNGVNITEGTTSTLGNVRTAATYKLATGISGCLSTSDDIVITSDLAAPMDGCNASTGTVNLSVTGGTGPFTWYAAPTGGSQLGTGSSFKTPSISTTTTYYVEEGGAQTTGAVGPTTKFTGWQVNGSNASGYGLVFDAVRSFTLNQVTVYCYFYSSNESRSFTVFVENSAGTIIATKNFTVTGSTQPEAKTLTLDFSIPVGTGYKLKYSGNTDILYTNSGATYPYLDNNTGSVVKITGNNPSSDANGYTAFYDWKISSGSSCARLPVVAKIVSTCIQGPVGIEAADVSSAVNLFPNPNSGLFKMEINTDTKSNVDISILNIMGQEVYTSKDVDVFGSFNKEINIKEQPAGLYFIYIRTAGKLSSGKLIKQ